MKLKVKVIKKLFYKTKHFICHIKLSLRLNTALIKLVFKLAFPLTSTRGFCGTDTRSGLPVVFLQFHGGSHRLDHFRTVPPGKLPQGVFQTGDQVFVPQQTFDLLLPYDNRRFGHVFCFWQSEQNVRSSKLSRFLRCVQVLQESLVSPSHGTFNVPSVKLYPTTLRFSVIQAYVAFQASFI